MKTEEDTFRVLSRTCSFEKVYDALRRNRHAADYNEKEMQRFLLSFGWTIDEYDRELYKALNKI